MSAQQWIVIEDDQPYTVLDGGCAEVALATAIARVDARAHAARSSRWVEVAVWCEASGQGGRSHVLVQPLEPQCCSSSGHSWQRATGGGPGLHVHVCRWCGAVRELERGARGPAGQVYVRVTFTLRDELQ